MQIQLIRNATMRIEYAGHHFVCDPYLADRFTRPSYSGKSPNPLVDLPVKATEVIASTEFIILSHLHSDHFDPAAADLVPKSTLIFCQPNDKPALEEKGFTQVKPVDSKIEWKGMTLNRVPGQHGSGEVLNEMGQASGFVFMAADEPTVYWIGDTISTDAIREQIIQTKPQIIITHSSGAVWGLEKTLIVMDAKQTVEICHLAPWSKVVAVHMEALDHGTVSRTQLRAYATENGIPESQLFIPRDGDVLKI